VERGPATKLLTKFNLILLAVFGTGGVIISLVSYDFLIDNARREVMQEAELMRASARSVRDYTSSDLAPLLEQNPQQQKKFLPETVPFFAATRTFANLRKQYSDYSYREAALNPTNPEDRATDWEADVIRDLRDHPEQKEVRRERETSVGTSMYLATAIVAEPQCMQCHSQPSAAPAAMISSYGSSNGFGWKAGEVIGAQIVSVPMSVPVGKAKRAFHVLLIYLIVTLFAAIAVLDAAVYLIVIRPLKLMSETSDRISKGEMNVPPLTVLGSDEISVVTESFNRMQLSLAKALKMLG
jgi:methyl-accepting chemotaxis protein